MIITVPLDHVDAMSESTFVRHIKGSHFLARDFNEKMYGHFDSWKRSDVTRGMEGRDFASSLFSSSYFNSLFSPVTTTVSGEVGGKWNHPPPKEFFGCHKSGHPRYGKPARGASGFSLGPFVFFSSFPPKDNYTKKGRPVRDEREREEDGKSHTRRQGQRI